MGFPSQGKVCCARGSSQVKNAFLGTYFTFWPIVFYEPRADHRAGEGVDILVSSQLKTDIHPLPSFKTYRKQFIQWFRCLPVYASKRDICQFFDEFQD